MMESNFQHGQRVTEQWGTVLNQEEMFKLSITRKFFTVRVKHWNAVDAPHP